ncbi:hypothetical protein L1987_48965 [Smallanthus sonchifolius]|uniref:Uncharacterized protein n=1 Tax=Smallanthus sonchifolius TaxID=185202 RepID=A0ACB9FUC8_9ASTR|nr:hypothetical protein L1987_48965 [Smallanthus sonchifolius]
MGVYFHTKTLVLLLTSTSQIVVAQNFEVDDMKHTFIPLILEPLGCEGTLNDIVDPISLCLKHGSVFPETQRLLQSSGKELSKRLHFDTSISTKREDSEHESKH